MTDQVGEPGLEHDASAVAETPSSVDPSSPASAGEPVLARHAAASQMPPNEPGTQVPLVPAPPPTTGEPDVDAAIDRLAALDELPVTEHVAVFDDTHRMLQDALADLDET